MSFSKCVVGVAVLVEAVTAVHLGSEDTNTNEQRPISHTNDDDDDAAGSSSGETVDNHSTDDKKKSFSIVDWLFGEDLKDETNSKIEKHSGVVDTKKGTGANVVVTSSESKNNNNNNNRDDEASGGSSVITDEENVICLDTKNGRADNIAPGESTANNENKASSSAEDDITTSSTKETITLPQLTAEAIIKDAGQHCAKAVNKIVDEYLGGDICGVSEYGPNFMLHVIASYKLEVKDKEVIVDLLLTKYNWSAPEKINHQNIHGHTALHDAAYEVEGKNIVKLLLENGADYTIKNTFGSTALDWAQKFKCDDIIPVFQNFIEFQQNVKPLAIVTGMDSHNIPKLIVKKKRANNKGLLAMNTVVMKTIFSFLKPKTDF